jgi:hypothetical protein
MIHAPLDRIDADVATMRNAMIEASRVVLNGPELRIDDKKIWRYPDNYFDKRGLEMWDTVTDLLDRQMKKRFVA